jgi:hypothetical protein
MQCQARFTHFAAVRTRPRPGLMLSYETLDRNLAQHRKATASSPAREERPC